MLFIEVAQGLVFERNWRHRSLPPQYISQFYLFTLLKCYHTFRACPNCFFGHPDHVFLVKYRSEIEISEPFLYLEFISMFVFIDEIRVWNMQVNGIWSILCVIGKWEWFRSVVLCWRDNRVCGFIQGRCHCVNLDCSYSRQVSIVIMVFDALSLPNSRLLKHSCWEIWI